MGSIFTAKRPAEGAKGTGLGGQAWQQVWSFHRMEAVYKVGYWHLDPGPCCAQELGDRVGLEGGKS